tara:strand:+ start:232 stop:738 length:507 start_codon:yes stop_codon:yes gene_type:complete
MILIISTCQEKLSENEFVKPIAEIIGKYEVKHYSEVTNVNDYEKIIICGTALQDNKYLKNNFSWLKDCEKPVLGICAGMQIIALTFGGKLIDQNEIGMVDVKIEKENKLLTKNFKAYALHNKAVENLNQFEILARSDKAVQCIKHKKAYGILFHPEVRNKEIIKRFIE